MWNLSFIMGMDITTAVENRDYEIYSAKTEGVCRPMGPLPSGILMIPGRRVSLKSLEVQILNCL